jgi:hypothetical protein
MWLHTVGYRLRQVRQQLGFVAPLSEEDYQQVARVLPSSAALSLFRSMSPADQQHALRVCRGLQARDCTDTDMLAAALLHDVGKAQNRVPFWIRPAIVLGKKLAPQLLSRLVIRPENVSAPRRDPIYRVPRGVGRGPSMVGAMPCARPSSPRPDPEAGHPTTIPKWRQSLSNAWYHADIGADLAASTGLSERAVLYIRTHHQPGGPAAELHAVDEVS